MKIRTKKTQLKASRIFTDREEPRAAFWQQYRRLEEELRCEEANVHVLTYYGIGGIGKKNIIKTEYTKKIGNSIRNSRFFMKVKILQMLLLSFLFLRP